ncbi:type II secretion system protein M [Pseudomonas sp. J452]|uniref:type II secretion system protein M n=1 Tax=Pseudomonas sp. J452 TaxID=2898441 RepID=UPI0021AD96C5|nr:type II secretion system protein M [Pseudomonas sp. J452]UUY07336.1 type II secretion system protein M [Pseudomonas sp. J452]
MSKLEHWKSQLNERVTQSPIRHRWLLLPARDRLALLVLGAFLAAALLYALVWLPIAGKLARADIYYQQQRQLYAYLLENSEQARQSLKTAKSQLAPEQLQGLVTSTAQQHGLVLERFDSEGSGGLLITLTQAPFEPMLRWVTELEAKGVALTEVSLEKVATGKVDARLTLALVGE